MRFDEVKDGSRFVFYDEGGLWRKTGQTMAMQIHGREPNNPKIAISPDTEVYAFTGLLPGKREFAIFMLDEDGKELVSIPDATPQQVAAYTYTELIAIIPYGEKEQRVYSVDESGIEHDTQALVLRLRDITEIMRPKEKDNGKD